MEKRRIKDVLLGGALALGFGIKVEEAPNTPPEKPVIEKVETSKSVPPVFALNKETVLLKNINESQESVDEVLNENNVGYDPGLVRVIEKMFSKNQIDNIENIN